MNVVWARMCAVSDDDVPRVIGGVRLVGVDVIAVGVIFGTR